VTVSPVISGAPAQATVKARPSGGSDDPSKDFSSYLRSSVQGGSEGSWSSGSIPEHATKTDKTEKQTSKKADTNQAVNTIAAPVPPLGEQPAPPLSITAILGLPTVPKSDTAETGKAPSNGETVLGSDPKLKADTDATLLMAKPSVLNDAPPASQQIESHTGQPPAPQQDFNNGADTIIKAKSGWADNNTLPPANPELRPDTQPDGKLPYLQKNADVSANVPLAAKPGPINSTAPTSINEGPKNEKVKISRAQQKESSSSAGAAIDPELVSAPAPQPSGLNPLKESSNAPSVDSMNAAGGGNTNGNAPDLLTINPSPDKAELASTPGHLAFALRLSEAPINSKAEASTPPTPPAELAGSAAQAGNADLAATVQAAAGAQLKEQSQQHDGSAGTVFYEAPQTHQVSVSDASQPSSEQGTHATAASLQANGESAHTEPVRNLHMQVIGDNNSRVDVRLMDRGGELHVSVKSGDTNLAQNLQDHMPELTARLEQQRLQAEVWVPKIADSGKTETSGAREFSPGGNNHSNSSNNSDQQGKRQQQYQPDWVDVLENSTQSTGKNTPIWLQ
jgi:hypothetical protein